MRIPLLLFTVLISFGIFFSCSEKNETFESANVSEFSPRLVPGKYITYRVDSLVFPNFGRSTEIHKYQQKHLIDAEITDNLGRPSYRVYRYIRDTAGIEAWTANGSYLITPLADRLEVIEDNMRFIKLQKPFNEGFNWRGNTHLGFDPYAGMYNFSNDDNMADWEYYYYSFEPSLSYRNQNYTDVWTVEAADEIYNVPITDPSAYAARTRAVESYAKDIGLVFRQYELWEYQPNPGGTGGPYKTGFGITQWMIDHN